MAGAVKHGGGCGCCNCPQTLCVYVKCGSTSGPGVSGASIVVKNGGGTTIASGTTSGTGGYCTSAISTTGTYTVEWSKTGYGSGSTTTTFASCGESRTVTFTPCPTSLVVRVQVRALACGIGPAAVANAAVLVNSTGGTTDANGNVSITVTPTGSCVSDISIGVTAPAGFGMEDASYSGTLADVCNSPLYIFTLAPSTGHTTWMLCAGSYYGGFGAYDCRYMPDTLTYTDNYGTATLTAATPYSAYTGSYSWTTSHRVEIISCDGKGL